jgi:hypothetical protein
MTHNHPFKRSLIYICFRYLGEKKARKILGLSKSTIRRAFREKAFPFLSLKYKFNTKRKRYDIQQVFQVIDYLIPPKSGRNYRLMETSFNDLYDKFQSMENSIQISSSTLRRVLLKMNLHHNKCGKGCPYCIKLKSTTLDSAKRAKYERHREISNLQIQKYLSIKKYLSIAVDRVAVVVHDFTNLSLNSNISLQCFCVCIYKNDSTGTVHRKYRAFVAQDKSVVNDINFVSKAYTRLQDEGVFNNFDELHFWSDGGPKHFKITAMLVLFANLQENIRKKNHLPFLWKLSRQ